jgi:hypothetical protein
MVMGPAKMMGLASVMMDFSVTTVQVNSLKPFEVETGQGHGCQGCLAPAEFQNITFGTLGF